MSPSPPVRLKSTDSGLSTGPPERIGKEVETMHRAKQVWQWMRSLVVKMGQQTGALMVRVASLVKKATSRQARDLVMVLGILTGAVVFGLWWESFTASLFAGIVLSFLAGIYKTNQRMLAALRRLEGVPRFGKLSSRSIPGQAQENSDALNDAIRCLKPWLANEVSLTEQNAKECCAVLVDSVGVRARAAAGTMSR